MTTRDFGRSLSAEALLTRPELLLLLLSEDGGAHPDSGIDAKGAIVPGTKSRIFPKNGIQENEWQAETNEE